MNIFKSLLFITIIAGGFILCLALRPPDFILSERRPPSRFPALTTRGLKSGDFMDRFERAATDNFPFRESLRTLRSAVTYGVFMQTDKYGLYMDKYGAGEIKPVDAESVRAVTEKINTISAGLEGMNIYYSFIPDKSVYAEKPLPGFDSETIRELFTPVGRFIGITAALSAESFYRTDLHWNQSKLAPVAEALGNAMGFDFDFNAGNRELKTAGNFEGVYSGQIALPVGEDAMEYYESPPGIAAMYLNAQATGFEPGPVYDTEKLSGVDPYDFFLRGAQPLVVINNDALSVDRELFIFRDSFSSSLAPLLATVYKRVTLIDLRYINMTILRGLTDFAPGSDVLFLYSSQILNNADSLLG